MQNNFNIPIGSSNPDIQSLPSSTLNSNEERRASVLKNANEGVHRAVGSEPFLALSPNHKFDTAPASAPYSSRQYNQLPTPQSPNNFGYYISTVPFTPESPLTDSSSSLHSYFASNPPVQRTFLQNIIDEEVQTPVMSQQTATPESSPFARSTPRYLGNATPRQIRPGPSQADLSTPKGKLPSPESSLSSLRLAPPHSFGSSYSDPRTSHLSSPFMEKLSIIDQPSKLKSTNHPRFQSDFPAAGGEMERIRQDVLQERLAQHQDVESRRPEYLKRTQRLCSDADVMPSEEDKETSIGITESPMKGRRLKLFQETSEESFEESLMAGGYGRYRTADWVRQPQPTLLTTPGAPGPSNIVSILEQAQEQAPPTEKERRKRKRLAAFTERKSGESMTKLHPVELEGRGRVLLDVPSDIDDLPMVDGSPHKKKGASRRKRKGELTVKDKKAQALMAVATGNFPYSLNWPDAEFPWKLRTQAREEELKAEEAEKLKVIERFLDRDSDDEEDDEVVIRGIAGEISIRRGRGKMVPLSGNPTSMRSTSFLFPSDPADARAALMSKKSVRTLSYRQEKRRRRQEHVSDDEVLCVCRGRDDGRELVQCDDCQTWYHLECIGIGDISELGKEEDPWFCHRCEESLRSYSPEPMSEPTFVPTDDRPRVSPSFDAPFLQPSPLQDSPLAWDTSRMPRTPTRARDADYEAQMSSGSTWVDSSRKRPMTPQHLTSAPRVYTHSTPGPFDSFNNYDEPFDPTSTPSRGIKFGATFATPKTSLWSSRANGLFQTPLKTTNGGRNKTVGGPGSLPSSVDVGGHAAICERPLHDDESPIRRVKSYDGPKVRRIMDSPLAPRSILPTPYHLLEESPIMRYNATNRRQDLGYDPAP